MRDCARQARRARVPVALARPSLSLVLTLALAACAAKKPPAPAAAPPRMAAPTPPPAPPPPPDTKAADEAAMKIALARGLTTFDVHWAPARRFFFIAPVLEGKTRLEVYSDDGQLLSAPEVVGVPRDLTWLDDARLVYRATPPPPPGRGKGKRRGARAGALKGPPTEIYVIQPIRPAAHPIHCDGAAFTFAPAKNRLAHVVADRDGTYVAVDGQQVYPRQGRTRIVSAPSWSDDGMALAFLAVSGKEPKLVLLAEYDNPTGDTSWPLPPATALAGLQVFWGGPGKLVVGESLGKPVFSTSFEAKHDAGVAPPPGATP